MTDDFFLHLVLLLLLLLQMSYSRRRCHHRCINVIALPHPEETAVSATASYLHQSLPHPILPGAVRFSLLYSITAIIHL